MGWADEISDGLRELHGDGAGVIIKFKGKSIRALIGSGVSATQVEDGGIVDTETSSFMIMKADLQGWRPSVGDVFEVAGKPFKIVSVSFDPIDPSIRIFTEGEEQ